MEKNVEKKTKEIERIISILVSQLQEMRYKKMIMNARACLLGYFFYSLCDRKMKTFLLKSGLEVAA
jgi:hypothetical protein